MKHILDHGLETGHRGEIGCCAMAMFSFIFQCRSVTVAHVAPADVTVNDSGIITARLAHRKAKPLNRPLVLPYLANPALEPGTSPQDLLRRWFSVRPPGAGLFNLRDDQPLGAANLSAGLSIALKVVNASPPAGFYYGSHSLRIGGFNELVNLQFTKAWLMQRLDWASEVMFQVYFNSRIVVTPVSA